MSTAEVLARCLAAFAAIENGRFDSEPAYLIAKEAKSDALAKLLKPTKFGKPWSHGPDQFLQECARQSPSTGLPAAADAVVRTLGRAVLMPVFRMPTDFDKKQFKAARMPHDYSWSIGITPDGKEGWAVGVNGKISFWSMATGELVQTISVGRDRIIGIGVLADGRILGVGRKSRDALILTLADRAKKPKKIPLEPRKRNDDSLPAEAWSCAFDASGERIAVTFFHSFDEDSRGDYDVVVYDPAGKVLHELTYKTESQGMASAPPIAFMPDGRFLHGNNREVLVLDRNFEVAQEWPQPHWAEMIAVSHDGARVLVKSKSWDDKGEYATTQLHDANGKVLGTPDAVSFAGDKLVGCGHSSASVLDTDGRTIARYTTDRYVEAVGAPDGAILLGTRTGNDPGPTEVLRLIG
jgi:hypothetical protein